jgi:hypothetical protein
MSEIAYPPYPVETEDSHEAAKQAAFVASDPEVAGLTLRPLSAGTLIILKQTGNPLLDGSEKDVEFAVAAFLYIHIADAKEVRKVSADAVAFRDRVLEFAESISVPDFVKAANSIKDLIESAVIGHDYAVDQTNEQPSPNS